MLEIKDVFKTGLEIEDFVKKTPFWFKHQSSYTYFHFLTRVIEAINRESNESIYIKIDYDCIAISKEFNLIVEFSYEHFSSDNRTIDQAKEAAIKKWLEVRNG